MHHEDHQIYEILKTTLSQGGRAVLATVIGSSHEAALGAKALYVDGEGLCAATKTLPKPGVKRWQVAARIYWKRDISASWRKRCQAPLPFDRLRALCPGPAPHHRRRRSHRPAYV